MTAQFTPRQPAFRATRAAAMNTAGNGTTAYIAWDTVQEKTHVTHTLGNAIFTPTVSGWYKVITTARLTGGLSWSEFVLIFEVNAVVRDNDIVPGATLVIGGPITMGRASTRIVKELNILANDQLRFGVMSVGASNLPLITGSISTMVIRDGKLRS